MTTRSAITFSVGLVVVALGVGTGACTNPLVGERDSMSCDFRNANPPENRCTDYASVGVGQTSFKASCEAKKAAVGESCSREGALGGCNRKNTDRQDNDQTHWYFPAPDIATADDVKTKLCKDGESFVTP